ncbi:MAG: hypothetical protein ABDH49_05380 [Candidatus Hydrothermales bacterium]
MRLSDAISTSLINNLEIKSSYENLKKYSFSILKNLFPESPKVTLREMFMEDNIAVRQNITLPTKLLTFLLLEKDKLKSEHYLFLFK